MSAADVLTELDAFATAVRALPDDALDEASGCGGWSVRQVVSHMAGVIDAQQAAFANMLAGSEETPPYADITFASTEAMRDALDVSVAAATETYSKLSDADSGRPVPLPFGTFPCETALDIVLLEYGVHRYDVAAAGGRRAELSIATADAVLRLMPGFVAFFGVTPAPDGLAYRLQSPGARSDASARDGGWVLEPGAPETTTVIEGRDSPVALFALGRIGPDDHRLTVTGDAAAAFKTWFPGP
jgi:uncharacterized protein (TIGR03083 family)